MLLRTASKSTHAISKLWKSPPKVIAPFQISLNNSPKKSSNVTQHSQRSLSTKKIYVPRSSQLQQFFNLPRHKSAQKIPLFPQNNYKVEKMATQDSPKKQSKKQRKQFLKQGLNQDYYQDQYMGFKQKKEQTLRQQNKHQSSLFSNQKKKQSPKPIEYNSPQLHKTKDTILSQSSTRLVGMGKQRMEISTRRIKSPKTLPVQNIISPRRKVFTKMSSVKSLEYTFGIN